MLLKFCFTIVSKFLTFPSFTSIKSTTNIQLVRILTTFNFLTGWFSYNPRGEVKIAPALYASLNSVYAWGQLLKARILYIANN